MSSAPASDFFLATAFGFDVRVPGLRSALSLLFARLTGIMSGSNKKKNTTSTSKGKPPVMALLTMPGGATEQVQIEDPLPSTPKSPYKRKPTSNAKAGTTKRTRATGSVQTPPVTHESVASMVAAAVSAAIPRELIDCMSAMLAKPNPTALSGAGEASQSDDRSVAPSATGSEGISSTEVGAPRIGDAGPGTSALTGLEGQTSGVTLPSTQEPSSVRTSASSPEAGNGSAQKGATPGCSSSFRSEPGRNGSSAVRGISGAPTSALRPQTSGEPLPPSHMFPMMDGPASDSHQGRPTLVGGYNPTLPVGHVGTHPDSPQASGGHSSGLHHGDRLTAADFRFAGTPSPTSGSAHWHLPEVEDETVAPTAGDTASQAGMEVPRPSGLGLPLQELLALLYQHLPQAFTQEAAPTQQSSYFRTLQAAQQPESGTLKVGQSLLATSALERAMRMFRGNAQENTDASGLTVYPAGRKSGSFPPLGRSTFRDIWAPSPVPHTPPVIAPADTALLSGTTHATVPLVPNAVANLQSSALSILDSATLQDITASALAASLFVPGTLDFRDDANPLQVWQMLQALVAMTEISAFNAALSFITTLVARRDHLLASATALPDPVRTSLRLAPPATTSLFGPAAEVAANLAAAKDEREARRAMVALASRPSRFPRGRGQSATRGGCAGTAPTSANSATRGRGASRSRPYRARGRGASRGKPAGSHTTGDSKQTPQ